MTEGGNNFGKFAEGSGPAQNLSGREVEQLEMPGLIQTGSTSPTVRDMSADGAPLSPADKKRNKLGYHRTAVACGHCRRRKIRCIPAFDDAGGRCQNCIRLKKDCHFYPVDQQNAPPGKSVRSSTKTSEGGFLGEGDTSVASSSPGGIFRTTSIEQMHNPDGPLDTAPISRESPGFHGHGFHPPRSMSVQGLEFPHSYEANQQHHQHQPVLVQSPYSPRNYATDPMNAQIYQQHYGHSLPTHYSSPFTAGSLPTTMASLAQDHPYEYQTHPTNGAYHWGQPTRSISSNTSEELSAGFTTPFRTHTYPSFERRLTGQMQPLPPTSSGMVPMSMEGQPNTTHGDYHEPNAYPHMQMGMRHEWGGGGPHPAAQVSAADVGSYSQGWYASHPNMTDISQDEGQPQILPSQNRNSRGGQAKPP